MTESEPKPEVPERVGELLIEVRAEELPPRLIEPLCRRFASRVFESLMSRGLGPDEMLTGAGRRRIAVCCRGLLAHETDRDVRELGPPADEAWDADGAPTAALAAFADRLGVEGDAVQAVRTERGRYAAVDRHVEGAPLSQVLVTLIPELLAEMAPGEGIRWPAGRAPFVRPIRGIIALLDGEVLPIEFAGVRAGRTTAGHPVLSPESFEVEDFDDYRRRLAERGIVLEPSERRAQLEATIRAAAEGRGLALPPAEEVAAAVARMAASCEIPGLVEGTWEPGRLELPNEVLVAVLRHHPGALVLRTETGEPAPCFLAVMDRSDDRDGRVRSGYQRLVTGRLADARFHLEADRRVPLAVRARTLEAHAMVPGHGSWGDHVRRVAALVVTLGERVEALASYAQAAEEAAGLMAADLDSPLVHEMPALRGVLGGLQARGEGYVEAVWQAVYDSQRPRGLDDPLPRGPVGRLLGVAARVDRLVAVVGQDGVPSASRDRHDLRGLALGLVRILMAGDPALDIDLVLAHAVLGQGTALRRSHDDTIADCRRILLDRARRLLGHQGFSFDEIEAAIAIRRQDLPDLRARIAALQAVREAPYFRGLVESAKRVSSILADHDEQAFDPQGIDDDVERALFDALEAARESVDDAVSAGRYEDGLAAMAGLTEPLDRFFKDVLVLDEDEAVRRNRLALLQAVRRVFWSIGRLKEMMVE